MSNPLRIAFLVDPLTARAAGGQHAPRLARELVSRGHAVIDCGADLELGGATDGRKLAPVERALGFEPDAIVAYDGLSPAAWTGARAARKCDVPLVVVEPASTVGGTLPWRLLRRLGERVWGSYVRSTATAVVAVDPVARDLALSEGFPAQRITILPEGVDLDLFRPGCTSRLISEHRIGGRLLTYCGPLEPGRGLGLLVRAFGRTVGQRPDWTLVFTGDGPHRRRLRVEVERQGLGARVRWLPRPERHELPGLLGASTLVAAPSLDHSARGRQVARAMACGLPVIASDLPRLRFLVEHGETGLLVPPGDEDGWTRTLQRAASSPEARRRWGLRARKVAEERLCWRGIAEAFEQLIQEALRRGAAA